MSVNELLPDLSSGDVDTLNNPPQKGFDFRPYLRIFQRKAWLIAGITSLTTFAGWFWSSLDPYTYAGNFYLLVEPISSAAKLSDPSTLTRTSGIPNEELFSLDYPTNLALLRSPGMTLKIAKEVHEQLHDKTLPEIAQDLQDNLLVVRINGTNAVDSKDSKKTFGNISNPRDATKIFQVSYEGSNPQEVQKVLETAAKTFLNYSSQDRETSIKAGIKFIDRQLPALKNRLAILKTQQQQLRQRYDLIDPLVKGQDLLTQIKSLTDQQLTTQSQLKAQNTLYLLLQKQLQLNPEEALAAAALSQDPTRIALLGKLQDIDSQIAVTAATFTPDSPQLQDLQEKRQNLLLLINQKTQGILAKNSLLIANSSRALTFQDPTRLKLIDQLVSTTNQVKMLESQERSLTEAKATIEKQSQLFPALVNRYSETDRQIQLTQQILDRFLTQRESLKVESAQDLPWQLISPPQIPLDADGKPLGFPPSRVKKVLAGAIGGLVLGMGLALLLEKHRNVFYSTKDIGNLINATTIEEIPPDDSSFLSINSLVYSDVHAEAKEAAQSRERQSLFIQAFDSLYTQLYFLNPYLKSLVISSVETGDGQSTIALNLAKTAAERGRKVLLVDANWRNSQLHELLNLPNHKGLIHLLLVSVMSNEIIQKVPNIEHLDILTSGFSSGTLLARLWSPRMQNLMKELQENYDLVIYDTPHFFETTDVNFMIANTNGVLMVVCLQKTNKIIVKQAIQQLQKFNLPILGIAANNL